MTTDSKTSLPKTHALAGLFCFHASRFAARIGMDGEMLLLADQDRTAWDRELLHRGIKHLTASASGGELSDFHLEAEIASVHSLASSVEATDWRRIVECYDLLQRRPFSPIAELNRVIAIGQIDGSERAFELLESLANDEKLAGYYLFHAARAHYLALLGNFADALTSYEKARSLSYNESTRRLITNKIDELRGTL